MLIGRAYAAGDCEWPNPGDESALVALREAAFQDVHKPAGGYGTMLRGLEALRKARNLSKNQLHHESGVKNDTISDLEAGRRGAQRATIDKLAKALGVNRKVLIDPYPSLAEE